MLGSSEHDRLSRLLRTRPDLPAYFQAVDTLLRRLVGYEASCWLSVDPVSLLPTSHYTTELGTDHLLELARNEFLDDDVNKFAELARATRPVASLSAATKGDPSRSARFSRVLVPHGHENGDELRAVFRTGGSTWGCVALHRRNGTFTDGDCALIAGVAGRIGAGIRQAILVSSLSGDPAHPDAPGLVVVAADDSVESTTPAGRRWLNELLDSTAGDGVVPVVLASVVSRARRAAGGGDGEVAEARLPRRTGGWLLVHASLLDGQSGSRVGVTLVPSRDPQLTAVIMQAHGLSTRECDVTHLVLQGFSTREIAAELGVSDYTVQDHLKAIFAKVGVRSRRELVAQLFLRHYAPRVQAGQPVDADGWFRSAASPTGP
jgi:DNA-binding CsgD family transcriptional regulator